MICMDILFSVTFFVTSNATSIFLNSSDTVSAGLGRRCGAICCSEINVGSSVNGDSSSVESGLDGAVNKTIYNNITYY
jgi:hypothetical protein